MEIRGCHAPAMPLLAVKRDKSERNTPTPSMRRSRRGRRAPSPRSTRSASRSPSTFGRRPRSCATCARPRPSLRAPPIGAASGSGPAHAAACRVRPPRKRPPFFFCGSRVPRRRLRTYITHKENQFGAQGGAHGRTRTVGTSHRPESMRVNSQQVVFRRQASR